MLNSSNNQDGSSNFLWLQSCGRSVFSNQRRALPQYPPGKVILGDKNASVANRIQREDFSLPNVNRFNLGIVFPMGAP